MRHRILVTIASFALAMALLINFRGPQAVTLSSALTGGAKPNSGTSGTTQTSAGSAGTGGTSRSTPAPSSGAPANGAAAGTFTGPLAANPYGDVQVQITVQNGKIVDVQALSLPTGGHSGRISQYVAPILRTQALAAQSARIDGVSGASYTSQAYAQSLQGALDQAGL